jgi:hypothetical protein
MPEIPEDAGARSIERMQPAFFFARLPASILS